MKRLCQTWVLGCVLCVFPWVVAVAQTIPNIRDGVVHVRHHPSGDDTVTLRLAWSDAWIAASQEDHVYVQGPTGKLITRLQVNSDTQHAFETLTLSEPGDYRIEVTGASFRRFTLSTHSDVPMVFEPAKIHKAIALPRSGHMFFSVTANEQASFSAKWYGGVSRFTVRSLQDNARHSLTLKPHDYYWEHDTLVLPRSSQDRHYKISWEGQGKVSFWLDGTANYFSPQQQGLFSPELMQGHATINVGDQVAGPVPALGVAFPFVKPPKTSWPIIRAWNVRAANYYFFADDLATHPTRDMAFLDVYENKLGIRQSNSILANTGRDSVMAFSATNRSRVTEYLRQRHRQGLLKDNYIAFADEPNLSYHSYDAFSRYFGAMASAIKTSDDPLVANTLLAVPQSSRFLHGPTRKGADQRVGIQWAEQLIQEHGQWIDAISWHEWLVRDLIDTPRYHDAVSQAHGLVSRYQQTLGKEPALIIGQTNVSSGASLSPYEQDTFFAALWWTSVVIQSSLAGKLDQLMWFKAADDPIYKKGLIRIKGNRIEHKPVSLAMGFITENLLPQVLAITSNHPELDILATLSKDTGQLTLLGVNKGKRSIAMDVTLPGKHPALSMGQDRGMNAQGKVELPSALHLTDDGTAQLHSVIPASTLFAISLSNIAVD